MNVNYSSTVTTYYCGHFIIATTGKQQLLIKYSTVKHQQPININCYHYHQPQNASKNATRNAGKNASKLASKMSTLGLTIDEF